MSIPEELKKRAQFRDRCRKEADAIIALILERLESVPLEYQGPVVSMVMTELQVASRKPSEGKGAPP